MFISFSEGHFDWREGKLAIRRRRAGAGDRFVETGDAKAPAFAAHNAKAVGDGENISMSHAVGVEEQIVDADIGSAGAGDFGGDSIRQLQAIARRELHVPFFGHPAQPTPSEMHGQRLRDCRNGDEEHDDEKIFCGRHRGTHKSFVQH